MAGSTLLVLFVLIVSSFPSGSGQDAPAPLPRVPTVPGQVVATAVHPFSVEDPKVTTGRVPLLEIFTATWCPPCAPADRAVDRLLEEQSPGLSERPSDTDGTGVDGANGTRGPDGANGTTEQDDADDGPAGAGAIGLAVLAYHPWPDPQGEDPFGLPQGQERMAQKYDAFWFPSTYVDGFLEDAPATRSTTVDAGMEEVLHDSYQNLVKRARALPAAFAVGTDWSAEGRDVTVTVGLERTAQAEGPFRVRAVLWEDHLRFRGSNGIEEHRMTVRALSEEVVVAPGAADGWTHGFALRAPEDLDLERAGVTVFVETAWGEPEGTTAGLLMGFAVGVGTLAAIAVFFMRRAARPPRGRPGRDADAPAGNGGRTTGQGGPEDPPRDEPKETPS